MSAPEHLEVWWADEFRSWGVTRYCGEDTTGEESEWYHHKADAVRRAADIFDDAFENLSHVVIYTKNWTEQRRIV